MSKRRLYYDEDIDEEMDELANRFCFRNDKRRNRNAGDVPRSKTKRNRHRRDEAGYDDS